MAKSKVPRLVIDYEGLDIRLIICRSGGRISVMPNSRIAFEPIAEDLTIFKDISNKSDTLLDVKSPFFSIREPFTGDNSRSFLPPMLESMQSIIAKTDASGCP